MATATMAAAAAAVTLGGSQTLVDPSLSTARSTNAMEETARSVERTLARHHHHHRRRRRHCHNPCWTNNKKNLLFRGSS
jgi:hypothetical protein